MGHIIRYLPQFTYKAFCPTSSCLTLDIEVKEKRAQGSFLNKEATQESETVYFRKMGGKVVPDEARTG